MSDASSATASAARSVLPPRQRSSVIHANVMAHSGPAAGCESVAAAASAPAAAIRDADSRSRTARKRSMASTAKTSPSDFVSPPPWTRF